LEDRRLMSVTLGSNLIVNPGAEANTGVSDKTHIVKPTGWTVNGTATVVKYGATGDFPTSSSPGPSSRGSNFFAGGPSSAEADLFQTINLSSIGSSIDAHDITFSLSGYLGGIANQADNASVFVNFSNSSSGFVSQVDIGPVTAADRGNVTGLLYRSLNGTIPATTRFAQIQVHFEWDSGTYNDAYADNLSFVVNAIPTTGTVSGLVFNDTNANGKKDSSESGLSGWMVYVDANNNAQFDPGETYITTSSTGTFSLTLKPGTYTLRVQIRSGFYETAPHALSFTIKVLAGGSISGEDFGVKSIAPA
jgi:hypothetical protein